MRAPAYALLPLLGACSYSLEGDLAQIRTEIVELQKKIPPEAPLWVHDGPDSFDPFIEDDTPHVPDFIYLHLLRKLNALSDAEVEAMARGPLDWDACARDPGAFRGQVFRAHGVIGELHGEVVEDARHPVRTVHAGLLFENGRRPVLFHVVRKPDVLTLREDTVETAAVFVKMIEYTSVSGRRLLAPFVVGKVLRRYL
ncbi:MAG TPA: hypothetical protein VEN81_16710 [Planctomycetota bacterium]|nr:hypothetical protein [Planctomycetota bacterium]